MKKSYLIFCCLVLLCFSLSASSPIVSISIDTKTETNMGKYPYSRSVYADAITELRLLGASIIVLSPVLDLNKDKTTDDYLALVMSQKKDVILSMVARSNELHPNPIPQEFSPNKPNFLKETDLIFGHGGWVPLPKFLKYAKSLGYTDFRGDTDLPFLGYSNGSWVKSSFTVVAEALFGKASFLENKILFGKKELLLTSKTHYQFRVDYSKEILSLSQISLTDILTKKVDSILIKDKIAVIGYDGSNPNRVYEAPSGVFKEHQYFMLRLQALIRTIQEG